MRFVHGLNTVAVFSNSLHQGCACNISAHVKNPMWSMLIYHTDLRHIYVVFCKTWRRIYFLEKIVCLVKDRDIVMEMYLQSQPLAAITDVRNVGSDIHDGEH